MRRHRGEERLAAGRADAGDRHAARAADHGLRDRTVAGRRAEHLRSRHHRDDGVSVRCRAGSGKRSAVLSYPLRTAACIRRRRAVAAPPRGAGRDDRPFRARGRRLSGAADSEETASWLTPDFDALKTFDCRGHVVTAPGRRTGVDFVSRSFFPALGVNEAQVCVSAHCKLAPFWAGRLERRRLSALQGPRSAAA
ncbi:hypothetical protein C2U71_10105 [Burkholderia ubonensis]|nr:hypothetical protein C2U71_10105 [Burkholderia ubonensis]